jgi:DNA-binding NarL/FixJ family response regulator
MAGSVGFPTDATTQECAELMDSRLSPRELQVAELVTEGLSDREISSRLRISQRTAESHVAHILTKLGFSSRVQVAAYMTRQLYEMTHD